MILRYFVQIITITHVAAYNYRVITSLKYSKKYVKPVVIQGEPAGRGDVPYMVSIKQKARRINHTEAIWRSYCGGSIIGPKKVLSAAHCFENKDYSTPNSRDTLRAVAGDLLTEQRHDIISDSTRITQWRHLDSIILHRLYNYPLNDIALVFLTAEWHYNTNVKSIPYAHAHTDYISWCTASGYGDTKHGKGSRAAPRLLIAKLYTLPSSTCSDIWEMAMDTFVCTTSAVSDVASGDSGGPLACKGTLEWERESVNGILVGVVCGKNFDKTTLFTRVSVYKDFIENSGFNLSGNVLILFVSVGFS